LQTPYPTLELQGTTNAALAWALGLGRWSPAPFVRHVATGSLPEPAREDERFLLAGLSENSFPTTSSSLSLAPWT